MATTMSTEDQKVRGYINIYGSVEIIHPLVKSMYEIPELKDMFESCITHEFNAIHKRLMEPSDTEITPARLAFKAFMEKEDRVSAIEIYVEEILGLKWVNDNGKAKSFLASAVRTKGAMLSQEMSKVDINFEYLFVSPDSSQGSQSGETKDEMLKRLMIHYQKARREFNAAAPRSADRTTCARFMRDTIENILAYIEGSQGQVAGSQLSAFTPSNVFESFMLDTLRENLVRARKVVEEASGGKKRRFDDDYIDPSKQPGGTSSQPKVTSSPKSQHRGRLPVSPPGAESSRCCGRLHVSPLAHKSTGDRRRFPVNTHLSRPLAAHTPASTDRPQQHTSRVDHARAESPHHRYPATDGKSVRRVFPKITKSYAKRKQPDRPKHGDRYRPSYK